MTFLIHRTLAPLAQLALVFAHSCNTTKKAVLTLVLMSRANWTEMRPNGLLLVSKIKVGPRSIFLNIKVFIDIAKLAEARIRVRAVAMHRVDLKITSPVLCIDPAHRQPDPQMHRLILLSLRLLSRLRIQMSSLLLRGRALIRINDGFGRPGGWRHRWGR